jgi:hypothetical protein
MEDIIPNQFLCRSSLPAHLQLNPPQSINLDKVLKYGMFYPLYRCNSHAVIQPMAAGVVFVEDSYHVGIADGGKALCVKARGFERVWLLWYRYACQ